MGKQLTPLIEKFENYCQQALGINPRVVPWTKADGLPLFLREAYDFYEVELLKNFFLLAADKKRVERPPATLQKQLAIIKQQAGLPVVYIRPTITSHNRHRLITHQVPFVIPGNQLYLPMLFVNLRERFGKEEETREVVSPSTQALMLHILYTGAGGPLNPGEMARQLHYTSMTMTRAFTELQNLGIGKHIVQKKNRQLFFDLREKALWEKVMPFLRTPVRERVHVQRLDPHENLTEAGFTALAHYSMIAEPATPVYACGEDQWRNLRKKLQLLPASESGAVQIELWRYRPELFAEQQVADRLSLYLSLREESDERVLAALDTMLREMPWS